jgi:hypothetical protein
MLLILLTCSIWTPALIGLGIPAANLLGRAGGSARIGVANRIAIAGLLGMFITSTASAAINLVVPAFPIVSSGILLCGWCLAIVHRRRWFRWPARAWRRVAAVMVLIAFIDARGLPCYDTGLYHLQAVRWITTGPLPRGLANLFAPLGYNCGWFTLAAAIETPLLLGKSCFVINAILTVLLSLPAIDALLRARRRLIRPDAVVLASMLIPIIQFGVGGAMISSLAPDLAVILIELFSIALWIRSPRFTPHVFVLCCFAVSIKLSAAPMLGMGILAGLWWIRGGIRDSSAIMIVFVGCLFAGAIFLARGIWLSGSPAFPSLLGRLPTLAWTSPPHIAISEIHSIQYWSWYQRDYHTVLPGTPWFGAWIRKVGLSQPMVTVFLIFMLGISAWIIRRPRWTTESRRAFIAMPYLLPAIAFWFIAAPQVRFGEGYLLGEAAVALGIGLTGWTAKMSSNLHGLIITTVITAMLLAARIDRQFFKARLFSWPAIPVSALQPHTLLDGSTIWSPNGSDQSWNTPLPTTPDLDPGLQIDRNSRGRIYQFRINSSP